MRAIRKTRGRKQESELTDGLKWSLSIHGAIALLVLLKALVFPGKALNYTPTLQVDLVALPDVLKKDMISKRRETDPSITKILKEPSQTQKSPKEVAQKDEMVLHPEKHKPEAQTSKKLEEKNKRILDRLKSLEKIQDVAHENPKERSDKLKQSLDMIKGNKLSTGHSLSGDAKEATEEKYYDIVRDHLNENFTLPPWLARQKYVAQVRIYLDAHGRVHGFKFLKASGNTQFDDAVKRAIHESNPFPKPPKELASSFLSDGIPFGFPL